MYRALVLILSLTALGAFRGVAGAKRKFFRRIQAGRKDRKHPQAGRLSRPVSDARCVHGARSEGQSDAPHLGVARSR